MTDHDPEAQAALYAVREMLHSIIRCTFPGSRTLDQMVRDMSLANVLTRAALENLAAQARKDREEDERARRALEGK